MTQRVPLENRIVGEWSHFEIELFNLVTRELPRENGIVLFSKRIAITQWMLDAFDAAKCPEDLRVK